MDGHSLKIIRNITNETQKEIAHRAGISPSTVSKIETGKTHNPTQRTNEKLQSALGIPKPIKGKVIK
ncbi:hypothetical protein ES705_48666 [subsurface metagenome]